MVGSESGMIRDGEIHSQKIGDRCEVPYFLWLVKFSMLSPVYA